METPTLLQTGPETFRVLLGDGQARTVTLPHHTRRGLGLHGVAPVTVASEIVRFLLEQGEDLPEEASLGALAGRHVGFVEELRSRLT
jgi:hypothetical protein